MYNSMLPNDGHVSEAKQFWHEGEELLFLYLFSFPINGNGP